jgi:hypothetical protein
MHPNEFNSVCQRVNSTTSAAAWRWVRDNWSKYRSAGRRLSAAEDGMISLVALITVLFFLILIGLVANIGHTINQKIEVQNAADSVAYSSTVWMARGMNSLTATNHLIGELTALVVIHDALGGDKFDKANNESLGVEVMPEEVPLQPFNLDIDNGAMQMSVSDWNDLVKRTEEMASNLKGSVPTVGVDTLSKEVNAGKTLLRSKVQLKFLAAQVYAIHAAGAALEKFPPTSAIGMAMQYAAMGVEIKLTQEYITLTAVENVARGLNPFKIQLRDNIIPNGLYNYSQLIADEHAGQFSGKYGQLNNQATEGARNIARLNSVAGVNTVTGVLVPQRPTLPVIKEGEDWPIELSQLTRATYPWVIYWRAPIMKFFGQVTTLSGAKGYYRHETYKQTTSICSNLREKGVRLYVMKGMTPQSGKGRELWKKANGATEADAMFCVMGFAHRDTPTLFSSGVYEAANKDGIVAYAQAMVYNTGRHEAQSREAAGPGGNNALNVPGFGVGGGKYPLQPAAYWDTLNWEAKDKNSDKAYEYERDDDWFGPFPGNDLPIPDFPGLNMDLTKANLFAEFFDEKESPTIRLGWKAKLTPVTRLPDAVTALQNEPKFGAVTRKLTSNNAFATFRNH